MPEIRQRYRTTTESAVVGESLAGLFVVETFLTMPDLFDTYIAIDPSLWWNDQALVKSAAERLKKPGWYKTLYLANSSEEKIDGVAEQFAVILKKNASSNLRWHYLAMPEEKHGTIYHPAAIKAFREVFKPHQ